MHSPTATLPLSVLCGLVLLVLSGTATVAGQSTPVTDILYKSRSMLSGLEEDKKVLDTDKGSINDPIIDDGLYSPSVGSSKIADYVDDNVEEEEGEPAVVGHHVKKRDLSERIRQQMQEQHMHQRSANFTGCDTCRKMHLDMKQASLDHIKKYVLSFLGFNVSGPPKRPGAWPAIPEYFWEQYYADQSGSTFSPGDEWEEERINQQQQQRYMDMPAPGPSSSTADQHYMADDPNWDLKQRQQSQQHQQQDDVPFVPVVKTSRIFLMANVTKFRHQQHDLMSFEFPAGMSKRKKNKNAAGEQHDSLNPLMYLDVSKAMLHVSFCNEHVNPALLEDLRGHFTRESPFRVIVHRLISKDHSPEKFSKEEVSVEVPDRMLEVLFGRPEEQTNSTASGGARRCRRRIQLDVSQVIKEWYKYPKRNHGLLLTTEPVRLKNLITMKQTEHKPFLELWTETTRKKRVKRDLSMSCTEGEIERRCCMYPLKVDFEQFGWDFIIAPKQYDANYCAGECAINFLPQYTHTNLMQLSTSAPACCSPKKMQPLSLLYFNRKEQVIYTKMENMIVETCGCS